MLWLENEKIMIKKGKYDMQSTLDSNQTSFHSEQIADIHVYKIRRSKLKKHFVFVDPPMNRDLF